jgi:hypothetical protein
MTKEQFESLLKVHTLKLVNSMTAPEVDRIPSLPVAVTRDEGGYLSHEIVNPLDPRVDDWRFFEDDAEIDWDLRRIVDDDTGKEAWSVCRVLC